MPIRKNPKDPIPSTHLHTLATHSGPINAFEFSNNGGTYILTGSSDRQVHLSRTEPAKQATSNPTSPVPTTTTPISAYTSHGYPILSLSITTDNTKFASSSADRSGPFLWDINVSDTTLRRFGSNSQSPHASRITCVAFTASDNVLCSGSDDRTVRLWDCRSRDSRPLMVWSEAKDGITALACDRDGYEVIVGSSDGRVRSYDVRTGRCTVDVMPGVVGSLWLGGRGAKTMLVGCLDVSADGNGRSSAMGRMRLMDRETGGCLRTFPAVTPASQDMGASVGMVMDVQSKFGLAATKNESTRVDSAGLQAQAQKQNGESGYVNTSLRLQCCLADEEGMVLSGSERDGKVYGWDVVTGRFLGSVDVAEGKKVVSVVKWREGSEVLGQERRGVWAAGGLDGIVRVYG